MTNFEALIPTMIPEILFLLETFRSLMFPFHFQDLLSTDFASLQHLFLGQILLAYSFIHESLLLTLYLKTLQVVSSDGNITDVKVSSSPNLSSERHSTQETSDTDLYMPS